MSAAHRPADGAENNLDLRGARRRMGSAVEWKVRPRKWTDLEAAFSIYPGWQGWWCGHACTCTNRCVHVHTCVSDSRMGSLQKKENPSIPGPHSTQWNSDSSSEHYRVSG